MWGYRTERFEQFGKVAARLDDVLGWAPARLTAISYALCGRFAASLRCWQQQARACDSPNAGPVMAAGAGALGVLLGGGAPYHGGWKDKPWLGEGKAASAVSIAAAITLMQRALALWLVVLLGVSL
ncbi:MAG: cobalamin biosynthesis protein, partial [Alcanivorax sp.]|nr:cobalamin biosynthesis protein [Alcanivorax sp.]